MYTLFVLHILSHFVNTHSRQDEEHRKDKVAKAVSSVEQESGGTSDATDGGSEECIVKDAVGDPSALHTDKAAGVVTATENGKENGDGQ